MNDLKRVLKWLKPDRGKFGLALIFMSMSASSFLSIPIIVKEMVRTAIESGERLLSPTMCILLLGVVAFSAVNGGVSFLLIFEVAHKVTARLRGRYTHQILRSSMEFHRRTNGGELIDRLTSSLRDIEWFIKYSFGNFFGVIVMLIGGIIMMFIQSWRLTLMVTLTVPPTALLMRTLYGRSRAMNAEAKSVSGTLISHIHALLLGIDIVKAFKAERMEMDRFKKKQKQLLAVQRRTATAIAIVEPILMAIAVVTLLLFLLYGGHLLASDQLSPEKLIAFLLYLLILMPQARTLSLQLSRWQQAVIALNRIEEILSGPRETDPPDAVSLPSPFRTDIVFQGVVFSYTDREPAIDNVSLKINQGERVGIVGESGAGKSTLFNLLLRFYSPQKGAIQIGGLNIQHVTVASLREAIAIVPQDIVLFDDTVLENVRYGRPSATDTEVRNACRAAQTETFIKSMPEGYQTVLGDRGMNLSWGERQRLSIARALLKDAPILLLDEATSSLDAHTEHQLRKAMETVMSGRTTLVIAHRLATVVHLPRIIILGKGRILDEGSHEELLGRCTMYHALVNTQLIPTQNELP